VSDMLAVALDWHAGGYCVIPAAGFVDGALRPGATDPKQPWPDGPQWTRYQAERPVVEQLERWFTGKYAGIGAICGAVSGNLEMLEFEGRAIREGFLAETGTLAAACGLAELWERVTTGYLEMSPGEGVHMMYRVDGAPVPGNIKLAERLAFDDELTDQERAKIEEHAAKGREWWPQRTLMETRGEGGFVVVAPSDGTVHPAGKPWVLLKGGPSSIPVVTAAEHKELHRLIRSLDQTPAAAPSSPLFTQPGRAFDGKLPGDDYNERTNWADILGPEGWTLIATLRDGTRNWRRPGKEMGMSATTGHTAHDNLCVFTSSTEFDAWQSSKSGQGHYTKFGAYALLHHGGDYKAASDQLYREGYGDRVRDRASGPIATKKEERRKPAGPGMPSADPAMFAGVLGDITAAAAPTTEADPVGIYASLLAGVGVIINQGPYVRVGNTRHPLLIWPLLLGRTGSGRKGEATSTSEIFLRRASPSSVAFTVGGLSSGEGLIERIRDQETASGEVSDDAFSGPSDKRLLVVEPEFTSVMARSRREGSTLAAVQRQAWDGRALMVLNRKALRASGSHVAIIGHITPQEFRLRLAEADMTGGTYNRYLPLFVERSRRIPIPEGVSEELEARLSAQLADGIDKARTVQQIQLDWQATQLWTDELYDELTAGDDEDRAEAEFTRRAAPYCLRVAGLLAVLDGRALIARADLAAAAALIRYSIASARYVLDRQARDPRLDRIRRAVDEAGQAGLSRSAISALFSRNLSKAVLEELLAALTDDDEYEESQTATRGRPAQIYRRRGLSSFFVPKDSQ
jgi:hypothetical protein